jgi:hypothetical protein
MNVESSTARSVWHLENDFGNVKLADGGNYVQRLHFKYNYMKQMAEDTLQLPYSINVTILCKTHRKINYKLR